MFKIHLDLFSIAHIPPLHEEIFNRKENSSSLLPLPSFFTPAFLLYTLSGRGWKQTSHLFILSALTMILRPPKFHNYAHKTSGKQKVAPLKELVKHV